MQHGDSSLVARRLDAGSDAARAARLRGAGQRARLHLRRELDAAGRARRLQDARIRAGRPQVRGRCNVTSFDANVTAKRGVALRLPKTITFGDTLTFTTLPSRLRCVFVIS